MNVYRSVYCECDTKSTLPWTMLLFDTAVAPFSSSSFLSLQFLSLFLISISPFVVRNYESTLRCVAFSQHIFNFVGNHLGNSLDAIRCRVMLKKICRKMKVDILKRRWHEVGATSSMETVEFTVVAALVWLMHLVSCISLLLVQPNATYDTAITNHPIFVRKWLIK